MFASIRHIAVMTENWDREAKFYQTIFGMKKITNGMTDEKGVARGIAANMGPDIAWFKDPAGNILSVLKQA